MYKTTIQLNHYFATLQHLRFHGLSQDQQEKKSKPNKNKKHIGVTNLKHSWTDNYLCGSSYFRTWKTHLFFFFRENKKVCLVVYTSEQSWDTGSEVK